MVDNSSCVMPISVTTGIVHYSQSVPSKVLFAKILYALLIIPTLCIFCRFGLFLKF